MAASHTLDAIPPTSPDAAPPAFFIHGRDHLDTYLLWVLLTLLTEENHGR
jgi:hypothetical protein